ncbi:hypothetical protein [Arthrobacter cryoconiti]|uniref:YtxH domain-containing protein n=1 Tax=Arthrobacter cryoconiti TaxID=748907 RepID=A0ABV8QYK4_9MICC|nr:hypothetical protein [Arthrobacter cryoconiti]MCC9068377.1 hypothetical protein [Arthrobacter cryoconiti]
MKAKLAFLAGLALGYVVGTRVGRRGYENLKNNARALWQMDPVQDTVQNLEDSIKEETKNLGNKLVSKISGENNAAHSPLNQEASIPTNAVADVDSDPALNSEIGQDWADEGGALPAGPAS